VEAIAEVLYAVTKFVWVLMGASKKVASSLGNRATCKQSVKDHAQQLLCVMRAHVTWHCPPLVDKVLLITWYIANFLRK